MADRPPSHDFNTNLLSQPVSANSSTNAVQGSGPGFYPNQPNFYNGQPLPPLPSYQNRPIPPNVSSVVSSSGPHAHSNSLPQQPMAPPKALGPQQLPNLPPAMNLSSEPSQSYINGPNPIPNVASGITVPLFPLKNGLPYPGMNQSSGPAPPPASNSNAQPPRYPETQTLASNPVSLAGSQGPLSRTTPNSVPISQSNRPWPQAATSSGSGGGSNFNPSPATSGPPSTKSSRNPSPIPSLRYDAMEGQFSSAPNISGNHVPGSVAAFRNGVHRPPVSGPGPQPQSWPTSQPYPQQPPQPPPLSVSSNTGGFPQVPQALATPPSLTTPSAAPPPQMTTQLSPNEDHNSAPMSVPAKRMGGITDRRQYPQQPAVLQQQQQMTSGLTQPFQPRGVPGATSAPSYSQWPLEQPQQHKQPLYPQQQGGSGPFAAPMANQMPNNYSSGPMSNQMPNNYSGGPVDQRMNSLSLQWNEPIDLLQSRNILPPTPLEAPKVSLPNYDSRTSNCNADLFRCTLTKVPESQSILQKARLPLGVLIHPFKDLTQLAVVQCNVIVRCRTCRTYINPFVQFVDQRRWKCNLCFRVNELAEEFQYDPITKTYGDPTRRPEIKSATIEFIAPSEYMLRPPQPAVYLFLLDVSHGATETGYLRSFCEVLQQELDHLPGDGRTRIGFITFDSAIHFYNLSEGLSQPQMMIVSDIDDVFLPCPDNLLANLNECKELVKDLLQQLPIQFMDNRSTDSALGSALQAAFKLVSPTGGRVTVMQTCLPNLGPGALKPREDPNLRAGKEVPNLGPANDFYKKLSLDCSGQQVAVDLFLLSSQYCDVATLSCISKFSGGSIHYYPGFHSQLNNSLVEKYERDLKRYLVRKVGFEAVMRIRCTKGLSIHTFHGNFFVRSTDLLSLPNINPDVGFAMQMSIEEPLIDSNTVCFQAALLYTSSKGERRIRVHTMCLPVTSNVLDVIYSADQQAIAALLTKMAVDRSLTSSMSDARDALINACVDACSAFRATQGGHTGLLVPPSLRVLPMYILAILKHISFRLGTSTKLDERVYAMNQMKTLPLSYLMVYLYPNMYPVHNLDEKNCIMQGELVIPQPPLLHLSAEKFEKQGMFLVDALDRMFLYVYQGVSDQLCRNIFNVSSFDLIPENLIELPELDNVDSERLRNFVNHLQCQRPFHATFQVLKSTSKNKQEFLQYLVEDRTESTYSYYEFLKHIQQLMSK